MCYIFKKRVKYNNCKTPLMPLQKLEMVIYIQKDTRISNFGWKLLLGWLTLRKLVICHWRG